MDRDMKTTEYLFGFPPEDLDNYHYWDALQYKLDKGITLFRKIYISGEDPDRCFWVNKAVEHTRDLLKERDERS